EDEFASGTSESIWLQIRWVLRETSLRAASVVLLVGDALWIRRPLTRQLVEKGDCPRWRWAAILWSSRRGTRSRRSPQRPPGFLRDISLPATGSVHRTRTPTHRSRTGTRSSPSAQSRPG